MPFIFLVTVDIYIMLVSGVLFLDLKERDGIWIVEGKGRLFNMVWEGQATWKWIQDLTVSVHFPQQEGLKGQTLPISDL